MLRTLLKSNSSRNYHAAALFSMSYPRISPIHSELEKLNPNWGELFRMQVALRFGSLDEEKQRLSDLALCDLSALPKLGLKHV